MHGRLICLVTSLLRPTGSHSVYQTANDGNHFLICVIQKYACTDICSDNYQYYKVVDKNMTQFLEGSNADLLTQREWKEYLFTTFLFHNLIVSISG